jgi:hypothetical protein
VGDYLLVLLSFLLLDLLLRVQVFPLILVREILSDRAQSRLKTVVLRDLAMELS